MRMAVQTETTTSSREKQGIGCLPLNFIYLDCVGYIKGQMNLNKTTYFLEQKAEDHTKAFPKLNYGYLNFELARFFSKTALED